MSINIIFEYRFRFWKQTKNPKHFHPWGKHLFSSSSSSSLLLQVTLGPLGEPTGGSRGCSQVIAVSSLLLLPSCSFPVLQPECLTLASSIRVVPALSWAHLQAAVALGMYVPQHGSSMGSSPFEGTTSSSSSSELVRKLLEQYCPPPSHVLLRSKVSSTCLGHHPIGIG